MFGGANNGRVWKYSTGVRIDSRLNFSLLPAMAQSRILVDIH